MRYAIVALILSFAIAAPVVAVSFPGRSGEYTEVAPGAFLHTSPNVASGVVYGARQITIRTVPPIIHARSASAIERESTSRAKSLNASADARTAGLKADVAARQRLLAEQRKALAGLNFSQTSRATWSSKARTVKTPEQVAADSGAAGIRSFSRDVAQVTAKPSRMTSMKPRSTVAEEVAARKASLKVAHKMQGPRTLGPPPPFRNRNTMTYRTFGR